MATLRSTIIDFALANPLYIGASVSIYEADANGVVTATLATLYDSQTGSGTLENPQTLDSDGKFQQAVYVGAAVICEVENVDGVADHSTGVIRANAGDYRSSVLVTINSGNTDVATLTGLPSKYIVRRCTVYDASTSLAASSATFGIYTGAGATGTTVVTPATLTALSAATKFVDKAIAASADYLTAGTLYLRCGTAHGSAATVSVFLEIEELP